MSETKILKWLETGFPKEEAEKYRKKIVDRIKATMGGIICGYDKGVLNNHEVALLSSWYFTLVDALKDPDTNIIGLINIFYHLAILDVIIDIKINIPSDLGSKIVLDLLRDLAEMHKSSRKTTEFLKRIAERGVFDEDTESPPK